MLEQYGLWLALGCAAIAEGLVAVVGSGWQAGNNSKQSAKATAREAAIR